MHAAKRCDGVCVKVRVHANDRTAVLCACILPARHVSHLGVVFGVASTRCNDG